MRIGHDHRRRAIIHTKAAERDGGYVLVMFALLLIPLLLFVGFSVDVGSWYNRASDMQKAADAASLAGVVWLPDEAKAREVALATAKKNGFDNADPNIDVLVAKSTKVPNRLQVSIRDRRVGSFIYSNIGGSDLDMSRAAFAEFVTPVPLGSPRNYFGLGTLDGTGFDKEYLYQSVNPYCTSKANGDRHQTPFDTGRASNHNVSSTACAATPTDVDYRPNGYELYIDVVEGRPGPIEILLYDARYNTGAHSYTDTQEQCTTTYTYTWPTSTTTGWTGPTSGTNNSNLRVNGPVQYQTRSNTSTNTWSAIGTIAAGSYLDYPRRQIRYRSPLTSTPNTTCTQVPVTRSEAAVDSTLNSNSNQENFTFSVYASDTTPLDDTDNPQVCTRTFARNDAFDGRVYLGSRRWNVMTVSNSNATPCTIPTTATKGRYIVRVQNAGERASDADGSNQWGIVARYTNASGNGLCDGRNDNMCPRVYGKDAISVRAAAEATEASFFLAEIPPQHAGKKLRIELWDPGEGGSEIRILKPTASANPEGAWVEAEFDWRSAAVGSEEDVFSVDVTESVFNARLLEITVDLAGYAPPTDNNWWKIYYNFDDPNKDVTDRTTWSARILGDPVHLIEE